MWSVLQEYDLGNIIVVADVAHELAGETFHRGEDAPCNDVACDLAEPQFELIQPCRIGEGKVQPHFGVLSQEVHQLLALVRREIICDHMNLSVCRLVPHNVGPKDDKLLGCSLTKILSLWVGDLMLMGQYWAAVFRECR